MIVVVIVIIDVVFVKKKLGPKILLKKSCPRKLWPQKIKVQRNLGPKKILGQTKFWLQNFLEKDLALKL